MLFSDTIWLEMILEAMERPFTHLIFHFLNEFKGVWIMFQPLYYTLQWMTTVSYLKTSISVLHLSCLGCSLHDIVLSKHGMEKKYNDKRAWNRHIFSYS